MTKDKHPTPRSVAAELFRSFLNGTPTEAPLDKLPTKCRDLARQQARNNAALIVHHAREARRDPATLNKLPAPTVALVVAYNDHRVRRQQQERRSQ